MSDDEPLELAPMLPALMSSDLSPTGGSVNVLDMISQDVMLGNSYQSTSNASTEVTYTSQYTSPSATPFSSSAPFTSAGDVFLPSIPITTAANTFVKPLHSYNLPTSRNERTILKPSPRHPHRMKYQILEHPRPAKPRSPNPFKYNPVPQEESILRTSFTKTIRSESEKIRKSSKKSSSKKKSKSRPHSSHKSSSHSKSSKKSSSSRSKTHLSSSLLRSLERSAFASATTRSGTLRSATVTHTVACTLNSFTESVTLATETVTSTTTTVAQTADQHAGANAWSSLKTTTVKSCIATGAQSPVSGGMVRSNLTTSSTTSHTVTRPRTPATIMSPMQSTYLTSHTLHSSLPVISRAMPAAPGARLLTLSATSEKTREKFTMLTTQTASTSAPDHGTTDTDAPSRTQTRLVIPVNTNASSSIITTTATTKHRLAYTARSTPTTHLSTNAQTCAVSQSTDTTTAACPRTLTQSTITLPPGATLYTARKIPAARATRSLTAVTTESQTITIVNEKGAYTTLTISSDFTPTTGGPLVVSQTDSPTAVTAGVGSQMTSITTDTVIRPRSQLLIPIANSQMNTSTSLGYLVTSPIGSDIISSRNSTAAISTQSVTTTATAIGTHTITTISSEALNKIRSRLIYNVPSTVAGMGALPPSTIASDSNRTRGPVTIIANQLISAVTPRDGSRPTVTAASHATAVTRALFSAATTPELYALTTPITVAACSSSTTLLDHTGRTVNRVVIPIMSNVHASPNSQSSASNQGTYIFTTGVRPTTTTGDSTRPSRMSGFSTNTTTLTSMNVASTSIRTFLGPEGGSAYTSSIGTIDVHSKLRNRLTVKVTSAENSMPRTTIPITAYAIKNRPPQGIYAYSATTAAYSTSTKTDSATRSPATMTLLTFAQSTSGGNIRASSPRRLLTATSTQGNTPPPTAISSITTVTPTLTNTGNHYVIKLGPSGPAASSVTAAVTSPITTSALSPTDHTFLEPHPVPSRLRTFPAPRTYPVAQRLAGNQQRPHIARNISQRPKKVIANPAPLQIFADVVCPPTTAQILTTTTQGHSKAHFTLSHCSGSSTLVVPQYKNTIFKNLSTIAYPSHERGISSRFLTPQAASDRLILNRSVALVSSRRLSPVAHTAVQGSLPAARPPRSERATTATARSHAIGDSTPSGDDHDERCD